MVSLYYVTVRGGCMYVCVHVCAYVLRCVRACVRTCAFGANNRLIRMCDLDKENWYSGTRPLTNGFSISIQTTIDEEWRDFGFISETCWKKKKEQELIVNAIPTNCCNVSFEGKDRKLLQWRRVQQIAESNLSLQNVRKHLCKCGSRLFYGKYLSRPRSFRSSIVIYLVYREATLNNNPFLTVLCSRTRTTRSPRNIRRRRTISRCEVAFQSAGLDTDAYTHTCTHVRIVWTMRNQWISSNSETLRPTAARFSFLRWCLYISHRELNRNASRLSRLANGAESAVPTPGDRTFSLFALCIVSCRSCRAALKGVRGDVRLGEGEWRLRSDVANARNSPRERQYFFCFVFFPFFF